VQAGVGIIGNLLESGRAELINDTGADPRGVQIPGTDSRSDERLMVVPLLAGEQVQGVMAVWRNGGQPFEAHELEFLVGLSRQATMALQNARLFDETKAALERQTATAEVLQVVSSSMADAQPVFEKIVECCERLFPAQAFALGIVEEGDRVSLPVYRLTAAARSGRRGGRPVGPTSRRRSAALAGADRAGDRSGRLVRSSMPRTDPQRPACRPPPAWAARSRSPADVGRGIGSSRDAKGRRQRLRRRQRVAADLCRPGGDRDQTRACSTRAGGAGRGRGRQRGKERLPRHHEPRSARR
jgi:hypothetical protein